MKLVRLLPLLPLLTSALLAVDPIKVPNTTKEHTHSAACNHEGSTAQVTANRPVIGDLETRLQKMSPDIQIFHRAALLTLDQVKDIPINFGCRDKAEKDAPQVTLRLKLTGANAGSAASIASKVLAIYIQHYLKSGGRSEIDAGVTLVDDELKDIGTLARVRITTDQQQQIMAGKLTVEEIGIPL